METIETSTCQKTKWIINEKFDSLGAKISPSLIIEGIEKYQRCQNRLYALDRHNYFVDRLRLMQIDTKNIGVSDNLVKAIAPIIGGEQNKHGAYPDIVFTGDNLSESEKAGIEAKSTWLRTKWKIKSSEWGKRVWDYGDGDGDFYTADDYIKDYKTNYGFGIPNPNWEIPNDIVLQWSAHYQNDNHLLTFSWDFDSEGFMVVIGSWFATLTKDDWATPAQPKLGSKNTPCVQTKPSAKIKLAKNWAVIHPLYYDALSRNGFCK